jgi:hypothetical protein
MTKCLFCSENHSLKECPHFSNTKTYINSFAPKHTTPSTPVQKSEVNVPLTQFEIQFGRYAESVLQDVIDHQESFSTEQINLSYQIMSGLKSIRDLEAEEKNLLDDITHKLIIGNYERPKLPKEHTEEEYSAPTDSYQEMISGQVDPYNS